MRNIATPVRTEIIAKLRSIDLFMLGVGLAGIAGMVAACSSSGCKREGDTAPAPSEDSGAVRAPARDGRSATEGSAPCPSGMARIPGATDPVEGKRFGPFCMDVTEVTVAAYRACAEKQGCTDPKSGVTCNWKEPGRDQHPINCVDGHQAAAYCDKQGKRLPSAAEWLWAARGDTLGRKYPWGDEEPSDHACWDGKGSGDGKRTSTCPVGSYPKGRSSRRLEDMAGNVMEWTSGLVSADARPGGARGGSWVDKNPAKLQVSEYEVLSPSHATPFQGFRCAR